MASARFDALFESQESSRIIRPLSTTETNKRIPAQEPFSHELRDIEPRANPISEPTLSVLENRQSTTGEAPDRTAAISKKTKWRMLSACLMSFGNGMNDSAPGALIPYIEQHYDIGYAIVSLIFVTNALGFICAAPFTHMLEAKLGRSKSYAFAMFCLTAGYVILVCEPPFPAIVAGFFLLGFGLALNLALSNVFCANLANATATLGYLHGAYGIGATIAPLIATAIVSNGIQWALFYAIPLAVSVTNLVFASWAFYHFEQDHHSSVESHPAPASVPGTATATVAATTSTSTSSNVEPITSRFQLLKKAIQNRTTLLGALFIFAYQGAEVSVSGWVVSFLISYRHGDPSRVGYVSAGFWAGITAGRFLLTHPAAKVGEKISVAVMVSGAIMFQVMIWLIPNVVGEAVMVGILGLLLGAAYPCAAVVFTRLLPRAMHMSSLSFISALGSSGGAVAPFLTGILAQNVGTMVLHPICIGLYGVMVAAWLLLPKVSKRSE